MPTLRRYAPAGVSSHVIVRGHNKMAVFPTDDERSVFMHILQRASEIACVEIHAFALMDTHAHLIVTPSTSEAVAGMMHRVGTRYGRYFNRTHDRVGAIWSGRYRAYVIDSVRYFLSCLRYVERNPLEGGIAADLSDYKWCSYAAHALGDWPDWLVPHPVYLRLGETPTERQAQYRALCEEKIAVEELAWLQYVSTREWPQEAQGVQVT